VTPGGGACRHAGRSVNRSAPHHRYALIKELHDKVLDDALFLVVAHDMNPRAMSRPVKGFVQAQSWFQDLTPISL
jgi:hypothetical protein